jgi:dTDP-4-amino-4,6-dideoxygalactose transaminase
MAVNLTIAPILASVPFVRPALPSMEKIAEALSLSFESGRVTSGALVRTFEDEICIKTGAIHAVAFSSATSALMVVPRALGLRPGHEVIVPSFTFTATAQALVWNGLIPVFCDCLPGTGTLDPDDVVRNITSRTAAICGVTIYGLPPDIEPLLQIGRDFRIPVYFDSAQGFGAKYQDQPLGTFGVCEVFSFSPSKVLTAIEGGIVTTMDAELAERLRSLRDCGKDPTTEGNALDIGLSARMSELHAAVALLNLVRVDDCIQARRERMAQYVSRLHSLRACTLQEMPADRTSNGTYCALFVNADVDRDELTKVLRQAEIQVKRYFHPPVHLQTAFQRVPRRVSLRIRQTLSLSERCLVLPLYPQLAEEEIDRICQILETALG